MKDEMFDEAVECPESEFNEKEYEEIKLSL